MGDVSFESQSFWSSTYDFTVAKAPDPNAQTNLQAASTRAGAYLSSWGAWATEKKKGWAAARSPSSTPLPSPGPTDPTPGDIKRAEEFKIQRAALSNEPVSSARTAPPDVEAGAAAAQRESVFFDSEKEKQKDGKSKEAENV